MAIPDQFIDTVVATRDLVVTNAAAHSWRLEPRQSDLAWFCDLDDGPQLDVRRNGPKSDLDRLVGWFGKLTGGDSASAAQERFAYTDPAGILDDQLRQRIEHWPAAPHGDGVGRPAELWAIKVNREGLIVESVSWWGIAEALDHQIALSLDIAARLTSG